MLLPATNLKLCRSAAVPTVRGDRPFLRRDQTGLLRLTVGEAPFAI